MDLKDIVSSSSKDIPKDIKKDIVSKDIVSSETTADKPDHIHSSKGNPEPPTLTSPDANSVHTESTNESNQDRYTSRNNPIVAVNSAVQPLRGLGIDKEHFAAVLPTRPFSRTLLSPEPPPLNHPGQPLPHQRLVHHVSVPNLKRKTFLDQESIRRPLKKMSVDNLRDLTRPSQSPLPDDYSVHSTTTSIDEYAESARQSPSQQGLASADQSRASTPGPSIPLLAPPTISSTSSTSRRHAHILSEQRRRENINGGFQLLKSSVPACKGSQDSKAMILKKAVEYILYLEQEVSLLRYGYPGENHHYLGEHPHYAQIFAHHPASHELPLPLPPPPAVAAISATGQAIPSPPTYALGPPPPPPTHPTPPPIPSSHAGSYYFPVYANPISRPTSTPPANFHSVYHMKRNHSLPTDGYVGTTATLMMPASAYVPGRPNNSNLHPPRHI